MVLSLPDMTALGFFVLAWVTYDMAVRKGLRRRPKGQGEQRCKRRDDHRLHDWDPCWELM